MIRILVPCLVIAFSFSGSVHAAPVRVLMTAFEAFGGESDNASRVMLEALRRDLELNPLQQEVTLETLTLPVVYGRAEAGLLAKMAEFSPELTISLGQAPDSAFRLELIARNLDQSSTPDNAGVVRNGLLIVPGAPETYYGTLPLEEIGNSMRAAGFPVRYSTSTGGFLCNHLFFHLMYASASQAAGFIHVPTLPPGRTYEEWGNWGAPALRAALETVLGSLPQDR